MKNFSSDRFKIWDSNLKKFVTDDYLIDSAENFYKFTKFGFGVELEDIEKSFDLKILKFTTMFDIHENPIYEGDIIKCLNGYIPDKPSVVVWSIYEDLGWFQAWKYTYNKDEEYLKCLVHKVNNVEVYEDMPLSLMSSYEILGNIFENPELLK